MPILKVRKLTSQEDKSFSLFLRSLTEPRVCRPSVQYTLYTVSAHISSVLTESGQTGGYKGLGCPRHGDP